jgi:hypothetical protein
LSKQLDHHPILEILAANGINPDYMVETTDGDRTARQILEAYVGQALDLIEGTEEAQIPDEPES